MYLFCVVHFVSRLALTVLFLAVMFCPCSLMFCLFSCAMSIFLFSIVSLFAVVRAVATGMALRVFDAVLTRCEPLPNPLSFRWTKSFFPYLLPVPFPILSFFHARALSPSLVKVRFSPICCISTAVFLLQCWFYPHHLSVAASLHVSVRSSAFFSFWISFDSFHFHSEVRLHENASAPPSWNQCSLSVHNVRWSVCLWTIRSSDPLCCISRTPFGRHLRRKLLLDNDITKIREVKSWFFS